MIHLLVDDETLYPTTLMVAQVIMKELEDATDMQQRMMIDLD